MENKMKIYYNEDGWVCERYPRDLQIDDEERYIEVSKAEYMETLGTNDHFAWRVIDGKLVNEQYEDIPEDETKEQLREQRTELLEAFDKWEKAVIRKREEDDPAVMDWRQALLDLDRDAFENIPDRIKYYMPKPSTIDGFFDKKENEEKESEVDGEYQDSSSQGQTPPADDTE